MLKLKYKITQKLVKKIKIRCMKMYNNERCERAASTAGWTR